jgi:hypothetical protein
MLGTIHLGPRDERCEDVPEPKILHPTDAIIRLSASCICGSDLWPFRVERRSRWRWGMNMAVSLKRWAVQSLLSGRASSSSARSASPTTPARIAASAFSHRAGNVSL